jgi:hypothetical protein
MLISAYPSSRREGLGLKHVEHFEDDDDNDNDSDDIEDVSVHGSWITCPQLSSKPIIRMRKYRKKYMS